MCSNTEKGYVYILTNKSFRDDLILIGTSSKPIDDLINDLDNEDLPLPHDPFATMHTEKYEMAAGIIHRQIDRLTFKRYKQGYDFFILNPNDALGMFMDLASLIDDATVLTYNDGRINQVYPPATPASDEVEESQNQE